MKTENYIPLLSIGAGIIGEYIYPINRDGTIDRYDGTAIHLEDVDMVELFEASTADRATFIRELRKL